MTSLRHLFGLLLGLWAGMLEAAHVASANRRARLANADVLGARRAGAGSSPARRLPAA